LQAKYLGEGYIARSSERELAALFVFSGSFLAEQRILFFSSILPGFST